jgi:tRNA G18 (ribose-2'-O)-methylase SpoU
MRKLTMSELNRKSVEGFKSAEKVPITVILDNVRSMHNVGSVFRTADAFLIEQIILCGYTPKPPHRDIQKTALGATETVYWTYQENTKATLSELQSKGYTIIAVEQAEGSQMLHNFTISPNQKIALIFGNEVDGVSDEALELCSQCIEIPQSGSKHSLNISVAAGIVLWECYKSIMANYA